VIACDIQQRAVDVTQALLQETLVEDCRPALHLERVCHSKLLEVRGIAGGCQGKSVERW